MFKDDKFGIGWGRFVPMDEFGSFDGAKFKLDELGLDKEAHACDELGICFRGPKAQGGTPIGYGIVDFFRRTV